ncbi:MAG: family 10 glycosylhydrolase [Marinilabiliaceae bacterium]|nr:family 10 glycosylhydrolase [Marinilabiliaceae bacterium]
MNKLRMLTTAMVCLFSITQIFTQTISKNESKPQREMRGLWVSVIGNIDWPTVKGLSPSALQAEATTILDRAASMGLNTIFLQVRPSCDVIYPSKIEPYSQYVVGENFERLDSLANFDALKFWIEQAHHRGIELHAWINPFRVTPMLDYPCDTSHISQTHPEWVIKYAGKLYLDPGIPEARRHVISVIDEIVNNYDIDGIHFDDYFYPYPVDNELFGDTASYRLYNPNNLAINDWRRSNVDSVIFNVDSLIKSQKSWLAFGISPFGVWRNSEDDPRGSETKAGVTDYDVLCADVLKWISEGWIDYVVPQIYWHAGHKTVDFDTLQRWWSAQSTEHTRVFVGHALFKVNSGASAWKNVNEMPMQIAKVRADEGIDGSVFFSYRQFNRDLYDLESQMKSDIYAHRSLVPLVLDCDDDIDLEIDKIGHIGTKIRWTLDGDDENLRFYVVYRYKKYEQFDPSDPRYIYAITDRNEIIAERLNDEEGRYVFRVAPIDKWRREHRLSRRVTIQY